MSRQALVYAWTVIIVGILVTATAMATWRSDDFALIGTCLALAALASTFKVQLPGLEGTISPAFVFILISVGRLGWAETVAVATVSALVQVLWRPKRWPTPLQVAFNTATLTISGALAHGVAHGLMDGMRDPAQPLLLAVAGVVLLVTNSALVAGVLSLIQNLPLQRAWRGIQICAVPYYLAGGALARAWAPMPTTSGAGVAILAAISVYLLSVCCRGLVERVGRAGLNLPLS